MRDLKINGDRETADWKTHSSITQRMVLAAGLERKGRASIWTCILTRLRSTMSRLPGRIQKPAEDAAYFIAGLIA